VEGADVSVLARGATLAAIRDRGLRVTSANDADTAQVRASDDPAELGEQDFVVIAVKAQSMTGVAGSVGPLLGSRTAVLSTLNGVPWWFLDGFGGPRPAGTWTASTRAGSSRRSCPPRG
jgi:2-dehydropantoate 2-reductase